LMKFGAKSIIQISSSNFFRILSPFCPLYHAPSFVVDDSAVLRISGRSYSDIKVSVISIYHWLWSKHVDE
jgi:hypothetical protein